MAAFLPQAVIRKKRDGHPLSEDEIRAFVSGTTDGSIADYQVSALLMAIFFKGLSEAELAVWADAMVRSGQVIDLSTVSAPKVDKHSTGGVGDKISIPLAPAVAACGVAVPMVSGRGLGHTGGTLDKLESIPGFNVNLSVETFVSQTQRLGVCLIGQTSEIAPADKRLYALRDVTATVESVPLIASSIMSKKIAEGIDGLVLDCKVGRGAFMKDRNSARALAQAIRSIGQAAGVSVTVMLTDMDAPIGRTVGNALEVVESIEVLKGAGPADSRELTVRLGAEMLLLAGTAESDELARGAIEDALDSGKALERFCEVVEAQGGDPRVADDTSLLPTASQTTEVLASESGTVESIAARDIGVAALLLGAGRRRAEDQVDHAVGIELRAGVGDDVVQGQPVATLHHNGRGAADASAMVLSAFSLAAQVTPRRSRVLEVMR